jgi:hypothetical protein
VSRACQLALAGLLAACGDAGLDYDGPLGQPVPATVASSVPIADGAVDGAPGRFLVDSGAPLTLLDTAGFGGEPGTRRVELDALGLRFPDRKAPAFDLLPGDDNGIDGILGGDILRHFALSIDYRGERLWVDEVAPDLPVGVDPETVDAPVAAAAALRGGGLFGIPDCAACDDVEVGATRLLVDVTLESEVTATFLVDTGASAVLIEPGLLAALPGPGRPRLDGVTVATAAGPVSASYVRIGAVELSVGPAGTRETSVPALVLPDEGFLDPVESEVGREVDGLLGGSYLRAFLATLDAPGRQLILARFRDRDHIDADEFVGVGFSMASRGSVWEVQDVYPATDAAAEGLIAGDVVSALDGESITGADRQTIDTILGRFALGDEVAVAIERGPQTVLVTVEDLLPAYETP